MLKQILENPEDLAELPGIIEKVGELEKSYDESLENIGRLQEINRKYLKMIPIKDDLEENKTLNEEPPTLEDAVKKIIEGED